MRNDTTNKAQDFIDEEWNGYGIGGYFLRCPQLNEFHKKAVADHKRIVGIRFTPDDNNIELIMIEDKQ
jgi:hypothetical protein